MVRQEQVDQAADALVEKGVRVTVDALGDALGRTQDLAVPLADWKRRRRYLGHLAVLDIPEHVERLLATMATAMVAADAGVGRLASEPVGMTEVIHDRLTAISEDIGALRDQVAGLAPSRTPNGRPPKREGRRRGLAAEMGRVFWDRLMQHFVRAIRKDGPLTSAQLLATLDSDFLEMASAAFERVDVSLITEKVNERVKRGNHFRRTGDGRYDVL